MSAKPHISKCGDRWRVTVGESSLIFCSFADAVTYVWKLDLVRKHVLQ